MHELGDVGEHAGVGLGEHAVTEVEDVAAGRAALFHDAAHLAVHRRAVREQDGRVQVALQGPRGADPAGGGGAGGGGRASAGGPPPVHPDDVGTRVSDQRQQLAGTDAEVDPRHVPSAQPVEDRARVRQDPLGVVGGGQYAGPRVEQLDRGRPGVDLNPEEGRRRHGQPVQQAAPRLGLGVHEGLGTGVLLRRTALDQVGGEGEGCAGEADERCGTEFGDQLPDRGLQERQAFGLQQRERVDVGDRAHGVGDDRAYAGLDVQVDPGHHQRKDDVGEQDGRIDTVPADRLQGDLGDQVGVLAGGEHPGAGPQRPVLGQGPAGLAHEPDRDPADRQPARGPDEVRHDRVRGRRLGGRGVGSGTHDRRSSQMPRGRRSVVQGWGAADECGASGAVCYSAAYPASVEPTSLANAGNRGRDAGGDEPPAEFRAALDALATVRARPEIVLEQIPAPQRLAPFAHAVAARVAEADPDGADEDVEIASARFIVLYDPEGHEAWKGTTRCVGYLSAATDEELVDDTMFSEVAWSWLTDALTEEGAQHHAVGGTVTRTASTRFGDLAGPEHTVDVEMRASWTAEDSALDRHLQAWLDVLGNAAGLPPPGVRLLGPPDRTGGETL